MRPSSLVVAILAAASLARAEGLAARDTARVRGAGEWSVGVFNPLTVGLGHGVELRTHPLLLAGSPNAVVRVAHVASETRWSITGEYGLSFPSPSFRLAKPLGLAGDLVPACKVAADHPDLSDWCQKPGWVLVPRAGVVASRGLENVMTAMADVAVGVPLGGNRGRPLDAIPALDLLFAPAMNGWRAHAGVRYDQRLASWLRFDAELHAYVVGASGDRSPFTLSAHLGFDVAVGSASRFTLGCMYWNSDQRAIEVVTGPSGFATVGRVRSNDFLPTIDFVWSS
jgi:hypothetical protein